MYTTFRKATLWGPYMKTFDRLAKEALLSLKARANGSEKMS